MTDGSNVRSGSSAAPIPDDETPGAFGPGFVYNPAVFGKPNSASRNDNPEAWVSGGHEKFETPVIPIQDEEHPAAAKSRASADSGTAAFSSERHPHEPEIPPAWNEDGRCLVCALGVLMDRQIARNEELRGALEKIAVAARPDGTYNLSREACERIAREALEQ